MKKIYGWAALTLFAMAGCSMDDVLDSNEELNLSVIETNNPIKAEPGEKLVFQFVASTSKSELSQVILTSEDGILPVTDEVSFAMIDENQELTLDQNGYFSRPVSTVLVKYPLQMPDDATLRGKELSLLLKVIRDDGKTKELKQTFEMIRYINDRSGIPMTGKSTVWMYHPAGKTVYDATEYKHHLKDIDIIVYVDGNSKYYCLNPATAETEEIMHELGYNDYRAAEMNETKFMGGIGLDFALITEKELSELVVENGMDKLSMGNNAVCGFITSTGRKGFAKHLYKNPLRAFISKMQVTAD